MTICIAGKNNIAVHGLQYLLDRFPEYKVLAIANKNDIGINTWQKSFSKFCTEKNVQVVSVESLYEIEDLLLISLEFDRIIKPELFNSKRLFNIHFSKLPAYKGMYTSVMPLLYGEQESGVTLHEIARGIDTGRIVDQIPFFIPFDSNARDLYDMYLSHGYELFTRNIKSLVNGDCRSEPQSAVGSTYFSKEAVDFSNLNINCNKTAFQVHNQVRAYTFRDYQLPVVSDFPIYKSQVTDMPSGKKAGSIVSSTDFSITLSTIDYDVILFKDKQEELMECARSGNVELYRTIRSAGYPIKVKTKEGWDLLIVASYFNQYNFVRCLLEDGWDVNTTNYKGTTAAMYAMTAASKGLGFETLHLLADKADLTAKDDAGKDLFEYATKYGNKEVMNFLSSCK